MRNRVVINGKFLSQPITGVQRFALEMVKELLYCEIDFNVYAPSGSVIPLWLSEHVVTFGRTKSVIWEQYDLPKRLKKEGSPTLINLANSGPLRYKNHFLTLHDVAFLAYPKWFSKAFRAWYSILVPSLASSAKCIFTVSEFSKKEIQKRLNTPSNKIHVIYNGTNRQRDLNPENKQPFILSVASLNPRKNIGFIAKSFALAELDGWQLILVGEKSKHFNSHAQMSHPNIKWVGYQEEETLEKLYNEASLFVSASLYEGFGIPVLEAMQHGCEIALSRIEVYQELFEHNVHFFDLKDPQALAEIMKDVASKPRNPTAHAFTLSKFNYGESAKKLVQVINQNVTK